MVVSCEARGAERLVNAGADLQAALDAARPGDTILLEAGATFVGNFRLPVHGGTAFVTVRSAAPDALLPPAGARITPAHARHLPAIKSPNAQPALATAPGAAYWRLTFLEFQATRQGQFDIITLGDGSGAQTQLSQVPHDLVLDRVYVHGDPLLGQKRGIALNSASTTIRNSHVSDIKTIGQDSIAVGGWNGPGPYVIENNYLEASSIVFLLGGADPAIRDLVPADITFRGNTVRRPLQWRDPIVPAPVGVRATADRGGQLQAGEHVYRVVAVRPAYDTQAFSPASAPVSARTTAGGHVTVSWEAVPDATEYRVYRRSGSGPSQYWTSRAATFADTGAAAEEGEPPAPTRWQVKNLLELKNARRVEIDGNLFEHNWEHAQSGVAILFTPRNQDGGCRWCVVEDVTFERNVVRGVGGGITILGYDDEKPSQQARNIRIAHNLFADLSARWGGSAYFLYVLGNPSEIVVDHNTVISPDGGGILNLDGPPIRGFVFTSNLARHNAYGIIGSSQAPGAGSIRQFLPEAVITGNVFAGAAGYSYPAGNTLVSTADFEAQFVDYAGGDFRVKPGAWMSAGRDGGPPGAHLESANGNRQAPSPSVR
jgi:hypothetical protein